MIESPQKDINYFEMLQDNHDGVVFEKTTSEIKKMKEKSLLEGFTYNANGDIVCEKNPFTDEDYKKQPQPIDRLLGSITEEGEYLCVDYSNIDPIIKKGIVNELGSTYLFIKKTKGSITPKSSQLSYVPIIKGMTILTQSNEYIKCINQAISRKDTTYTAIDTLSVINNIKEFLTLGVNMNIIEKLFNNPEDTSKYIAQIHEFTISEQNKNEIFGEYSDKVGDVGIISGSQRLKVKEKLGDQFDRYVGKFISGLNKLYTPYFKEPDLATYLLSPGCKITTENIDQYISLLNKYNGTTVNLGNYSPAEAEEIISYVLSNNLMGLSIYDENTLNTIRLFKTNGITSDMIKFIGTGTNSESKILETYHAHFVEELLINEPEGKNLFNFLSKYPQTLNVGGNEIKEIQLNTKKRNFCFRGILEMIKSRGDITVLPYPEDTTNIIKMKEWKRSWEKVIKEYENFLKSYIGLDFYENSNGEKIQIDRKNTFDKIFYSMATGDEDPKGSFKGGFSLEHLQAFSNNEVSDYSSKVKNGDFNQLTQKKLITDICNYADNHKDEKILLFIGTHGGENGESGNGRKKEDWLKISKYPNIKIISERCFFGTIYTNENEKDVDYIYNQQAQISGFSDKTRSTNEIGKYLLEGFNKGLGFHELELYVRLHYGIISPLTENFEYTDRSTGEKKQKNIGLAYEGEGDTFDNIT